MIGLISLREALQLDSCDAADLDCHTLAEVLDIKRQAENYQRLLKSIRARGITEPIVIIDGCIMEGHHRLAAAAELGLPVIPWSDVELCAPNPW